MNENKEVAVFYNLKVHERFEIDNAEVLLSRDLDKIECLAGIDLKIPWMICAEYELHVFSDFYKLIHDNILTSGYLHFYQ